MFSKVFLASIVSATIALTGCSQLQAPSGEPKSTNFLSGREGINGQLLVVKIDDTNMAHPQIGIEDADVVYIEQVEGGLTRLAAIFSSVIPMRVGPVRSARISDIEILSQYGRAAFAYSGAQQKLLPVIAAANLQDLGAQRQSPTIYTRDPSRISPYSMVLRSDLLMQKVTEEQLQVDSAKDVGFTFGQLPLGGQDVASVEVNWPATTYSASWSLKESRWLLSHNGSVNLSESGLVLGPTTLIIQMVSITNSEYKDKVGGITPLSQTIGTGKAYVLRDGRSFLATWSRPSSESGTSFRSPSGEEIPFAPGQIWIALTDREPIFTSPPTPKTK